MTAKNEEVQIPGLIGQFFGKLKIGLKKIMIIDKIFHHIGNLIFLQNAFFPLPKGYIT